MGVAFPTFESVHFLYRLLEPKACLKVSWEEVSETQSDGKFTSNSCGRGLKKLVVKAREPGVFGSLIRFKQMFVQWGLLWQFAVPA